MHPCQLIFVMIFFGIDLLMYLLQFSVMTTALSRYPLLLIMFYMMVLIYVVGFVVAYKAYQCFKKVFTQ